MDTDFIDAPDYFRIITFLTNFIHLLTVKHDYKWI